MAFPNISQDEEKIFTRLAKKMRIKNEIEEITTELEKNTIKAEIEGKDYTQEQEELETRKKALEEEYAELSEDFPYITLKNNVTEATHRLQKLEEKKSTISEKVYKLLYEEYSEKLTTLQTTLAEEERHIREIQKQCELFLDHLEETKEEVKVRYELEEINKDDMENELQDLNKQYHRATDLVKVINQILG
ncbi:MAG: hypothetical protein ACFFD1_05395 [Candidatus Thorarchaeota archaeon]